ncbi:MAG: carbohydrate kinase family protein [Actinobacteria bacterium]|nr:carbohydrate kinase family protein [Actinomycetota bacterium]
MARILCIGDAMLDVIVRMQGPMYLGSDTISQISTHAGGAAANTATWLASTSHSVFYVCRLGDDAAGQVIANQLDTWNIEFKREFLSGHRTGIVVVLVDQNGERSMFPDRGANSGLSEIDLPDLSRFDAVFLSGYSLFNPLSQDGVLRMIDQIRKANVKIFFNPGSVGVMSNLGPEICRARTQLMDLLIMNEAEAEFLTGQSDTKSALEQLSQDVETVVITANRKGAMGRLRGQEIIDSPIKPITAIDSTGAGDAFAAGFIGRWIESKDLESSLRAGNSLASGCVATIGARPSVNPE